MSALTLPEPLSLRTAEDSDLEFLRGVYRGTRWDALEITGWSEEQKLAFVNAQFDTQNAYYRAHYTDAEFLVVLEASRRVGRLYLHRSSQELRVMDIALLPEHRRRGIGAKLMHAILESARASKQRVSLHVELHNPARQWYERLGFRVLEERGIYLFMTRLP